MAAEGPLHSGGTDEPEKPIHSLPSYNEPTPETHRKMSREEEAELALSKTAFTPGTRGLLIALFLVTILSVPTIQVIAHFAASNGKAVGLWPSQPLLAPAGGAPGLLARVPDGKQIKRFEKALENESVVSQWLLPRVQLVLSGQLGVGNEQAFPGRDGWLFYRPDVEYVTGPPFLAPAQMKRRIATGVQPDPVKAIVDFRDQLGRRGIELIVVPAPVKPTIEGALLAGRQSTPSAVLQNPSYPELIARLERASVRVFDPAPLLKQQTIASGKPVYLETDTHWRPEAMELVAKELAQFARRPAPAEPAEFTITPKQISGFGDIEVMLKLPASQQIYRPQQIVIDQVTRGTGIWRQSSDAEVLLLGDSFSNIFSLEAMGWGESAGFAEHLSADLRSPLDCILRNSDASFATRELLSRELARGHDRLAGKKLVIWEFATRELAFGDWKILPLDVGGPPPSHGYVEAPGGHTIIKGTVQAVSSVPRPGSVPYKDHILTINLVDLSGIPPEQKGVDHALVYLMSMRDNVWTPAARLRPGDQITVTLQAWSDVSEKYDKLNRSELDDPALALEEPAWGELAPDHDL